MELGILDVCRRSEMKSPRQALEETLELACLADALGYKRYWLAEHHTDEVAHTSPEALLPLLASRTNTIRLGSGGVLLRYYSPLKVAETFLAIEAMFPGRLDLGVCRGIGVDDDLTARALVSGNTWELTERAFQHKVEELLRLYRGTSLAGYSDENAARVRPCGVKPPPVWILGSGSKSMKLAAATGTPYSFMPFYDYERSWGPALMRQYRESFSPGPERNAPSSNIVVALSCAETDSLAQQRKSGLLSGDSASAGRIVGSPTHCAKMLREFSELYGTSEVLLMICEDGYEERRNAYRWIADECGIRSW